MRLQNTVETDIDFIHAVLRNEGHDTSRDGARELWERFSASRSCDWVRLDNYGPPEIAAVAAEFGLAGTSPSASSKVPDALGRVGEPVVAGGIHLVHRTIVTGSRTWHVFTSPEEKGLWVGHEDRAVAEREVPAVLEIIRRHRAQRAASAASETVTGAGPA